MSDPKNTSRIVQVRTLSLSSLTDKHRLLIGAGAMALFAALASLHLPANRANAALPPADSNVEVVKMPASFADLAEQVRPAVVNISVSGNTFTQRSFKEQPHFPHDTPFNDFFEHFFLPPNSPKKRQALGSGFIISSDGYIVTNHHVIDDSETITATLNNGEQHLAHLIGVDAKTDLALLKIDTKQTLPFVRFGNAENARVGDWVVAVGNPFGLGGTFTAGIISARGRDLENGTFSDFLQIDAPLNKGNSGGPLFNTRGEVIGINTAIFSPNGGNVGIGFAVPSNTAENIITALRENGYVERGWLGVQIQKLTPELAEGFALPETQGALVSQILPDSPAAVSDLQSGDVITQVDGQQVKDFKALSRLIAQGKAGQTIQLQVWRKGKSQSLSVTLSNYPDSQPVASNKPAQHSRLGVQLQSLNDKKRQELGLAENTEGVLIRDVEAGSPAARQGLRSGDVILQIGQEKAQSPRQVAQVVRQADEDKLLLLIMRQGQQQFVVVPMG